MSLLCYSATLALPLRYLLGIFRVFFYLPLRTLPLLAATTSAKPTILNSLYTPFSFGRLPMRHAFSQPLKEISLELTLIVVLIDVYCRYKFLPAVMFLSDVLVCLDYNKTK